MTREKYENNLLTYRTKVKLFRSAKETVVNERSDNNNQPPCTNLKHTNGISSTNNYDDFKPCHLLLYYLF